MRSDLLTFIISVLSLWLNEFKVGFSVAQLVFAFVFVVFAFLYLLILFWAWFGRVGLRVLSVFFLVRLNCDASWLVSGQWSARQTHKRVWVRSLVNEGWIHLAPKESEQVHLGLGHESRGHSGQKRLGGVATQGQFRLVDCLLLN